MVGAFGAIKQTSGKNLCQYSPIDIKSLQSAPYPWDKNTIFFAGPLDRI